MIVALALVAGASLSFVEAAKKDKKTPKKPVVELRSGSDSLSYSAGYTLAEIVRDRFLGSMQNELKGSADSLQLNMAYQGLFDALVADTTLFNARSAEKFITERMTAFRIAREEKHKSDNNAYLGEYAKQEGVVTLPSGLMYKVLTKGDGAIPTDSDKVQVIYEGRLIDGTVFDSTAKHGGKPAVFIPQQVIKGWQEALTMMPVGSKWQLCIPQNLAYGNRRSGSIPAYSTLIFDVELVGIGDPKREAADEKNK